MSSERPSLNVPAAVLAQEPTLVANGICSFSNTSCQSQQPPAESIGVSVKVQTVDSIDDVNQLITFNFELTMRWRDWRLSYAEGGFGCWAATAQAPSTSLNQTAALSAVQQLWGCSAGGICSNMVDLQNVRSPRTLVFCSDDTCSLA